MGHRPGPLETLAGPPFVAVGSDALSNPHPTRRRGRAPGAPEPVLLDGRHMRAIERSGRGYRAILDRGPDLQLGRDAAEKLRVALSLPSLDELLPTTDALRWLCREGIRDWPYELYEAPASALRRDFGTDRRCLMANALWQAYRYRAAGRPEHYGTSIRGLWYVPIVNVMARAGLRHQDARPADLLARDDMDPDFHAYEALLRETIGEQRLFTYRALGIREPRPDLHAVGGQDPSVVLYVEKSSLQDGVDAIVDRHGPSHIIMGGLSTYLATEFFVDALHAAGVRGPLTIMAYVDFDPGGWMGVASFVRHLERYGMSVDRIGYMVRPSRFTAAELRLHALPLPTKGRAAAAVNRAWIETGGGVHGKPYGIHADNLWPVDRALRAYEAELGGTR